MSKFIYTCQNCKCKFTHYSSKMIILKDSIWNSFFNKSDILCYNCIETKLGRTIKVEELWTTKSGWISPLNRWFTKLYNLDNKI